MSCTKKRCVISHRVFWMVRQTSLCTKLWAMMINLLCSSHILFYLFISWWPFQWVHVYQDATLCLPVVLFIINVLYLGTLVEITQSSRSDGWRELRWIKPLLESNWEKVESLCCLVSRLRRVVQTTGAAQRIAAWKLIHSRVQTVQDPGRKDVRVKKKKRKERNETK